MATLSLARLPLLGRWPIQTFISTFVKVNINTKYQKQMFIGKLITLLLCQHDVDDIIIQFR